MPYGRQARIWVTTEIAYYRIMSVSANYISYWQPFYEMVCFAGHVVNVLINYQGPVQLVKLVGKISRLSKKSSEETYILLREHRKFIQDLLKDQNLSARIRKEYNSMQSNQTIWELSWEEHLQSLQPKNKKKMNILSFFQSKTNLIDENSAESVPNPAKLFDETSSLLSISEDESETYIEYSFENFDELKEQELEAEELTVEKYLKSSFTSANFMNWKLPEHESFNESFYNCPVCNLTFKTIDANCFSAFSVHLRAHRAEYKEAREEGSSALDDFEKRLTEFKMTLKNLIEGEVSYNPIPLKFEKKINNFSGSISDRPFKKVSILEYEDSPNISYTFNPIKAIKFSISIESVSRPSSPASTSASVNPPAAKKPRAPRKPKVAPVTPTGTVPVINPVPQIVGSSSNTSSNPTSPVSSTAIVIQNLVTESLRTDVSPVNKEVALQPILVPEALLKSIPASGTPPPVTNNNNVATAVKDQEKPVTAVVTPRIIKLTMNPPISKSPSPQQEHNLQVQRTLQPKPPTIPDVNLPLSDEAKPKYFTNNQVLSTTVPGIKRSFSAVPVPIEFLGPEDSIASPTNNFIPKPVASIKPEVRILPKSPQSNLEGNFLTNMAKPTTIETATTIPTTTVPTIATATTTTIPTATSSPFQNFNTVNNSKPGQAKYLDYLKETMAYWNRKPVSTSVEATSSTIITNTTNPRITVDVDDVKSSRSCWNCLNKLPSGSDGTFKSKFCHHCSAIIE